METGFSKKGWIDVELHLDIHAITIFGAIRNEEILGQRSGRLFPLLDLRHVDKMDALLVERQQELEILVHRQLRRPRLIESRLLEHAEQQTLEVRGGRGAVERAVRLVVVLEGFEDWL